MDEEFHMGPYLQDILLAGVFQLSMTRFHEGTPVNERTSCRVDCSEMSRTFSSKSGISAVFLSGMRRMLAMAGVFSIRMADRSPDIMLSPSRSMRLEPPSVSIFPFTTLVLG